jgi:hypothetical protein
MELQLEALERVWGTVEEWQATYAGWKETKFGDVKARLTWGGRGAWGVAGCSHGALEACIGASLRLGG